jgi:hypothetical protein
MRNLFNTIRTMKDDPNYPMQTIITGFFSRQEYGPALSLK